MPDIGWMELLVIGVVALIVVGPKDLPVMFRKLGQFTGRIRAMARDFQNAMDDAARESGMDDLKRDFSDAAKYTNPRKMGMDALNDAVSDIDPTKYTKGSATRDLAEQKAARQKTQRDAAAERIKSGRAEPNDAVAPVEETATGPADAPADTTPAPARTGTDPS